MDMLFLDKIVKFAKLLIGIIIHNTWENKRRPLWAMACFLIFGLFSLRAFTIKNSGSYFISRQYIISSIKSKHIFEK
jgi:hypothetical protein